MEKIINYSIITSTHNRGTNGFLEKCIKSVQNQEKGDFTYEHLVIDDGSTDCTREVVKKYSAEDNRIKYYYKKNGGSASAWKFGINKAQGDYLIFLDDDDMFSIDSLRQRTSFLKKNKCDWFYAKAKWINKNDEFIGQPFQSEYYKNFLYEKMLISNCIHGGTPVIKSEIVKKIKWPTWLERSQDYFLWLELLRPNNDYSVKFLDRYVYYYRFYPEGYTALIEVEPNKFQEKEKLNLKIKKLHGESLAFLADEVYKTRKELWSSYNRNNELDMEINSLRAEIARIKNSSSWRIMKPLRFISKSLRKK